MAEIRKGFTAPRHQQQEFLIASTNIQFVRKIRIERHNASGERPDKTFA
jgi:hypothetical protein